MLTLIPKRNRSAVSMRADETDNWGQEALDEKEAYTLMLRDPSIKVRDFFFFFYSSKSTSVLLMSRTVGVLHIRVAAECVSV